MHCCWKSGLVRWHLTASSRQQHAHCGPPCHTCAGRSRHKKKDVRSTSLICTGVRAQLYSFSALMQRISSGYSPILVSFLIPRLRPYFSSLHRGSLGTRLSPFPVWHSVPFPYHIVWDGIRVEAVCPTSSLYWLRHEMVLISKGLVVTQQSQIFLWRKDSRIII